MKTTPKPGLKEAPDSIADVALEMISHGETSRILEAYRVDLNLVISPIFKEAVTSKKASRK